MSSVVFDVPDVSCEHCERTITGALQPIAGVREVSVDVPARTVAVAFDDRIVGVERLKQVLTDEDYPVAAER
ncbi:MAG TPA: heavy-metal-associated domain-containing protein [Candidatus Dormibacteraeota bacterium]|jgi:copper chaperone